METVREGENTVQYKINTGLNVSFEWNRGIPLSLVRLNQWKRDLETSSVYHSVLWKVIMRDSDIIGDCLEAQLWRFHSV